VSVRMRKAPTLEPDSAPMAREIGQRRENVIGEPAAKFSRGILISGTETTPKGIGKDVGASGRVGNQSMEQAKTSDRNSLIQEGGPKGPEPGSLKQKWEVEKSRYSNRGFLFDWGVGKQA